MSNGDKVYVDIKFMTLLKVLAQLFLALGILYAFGLGVLLLIGIVIS